jgi:hypothetical protein
MPASSNRQRSMRCPTRYDTCSLPLPSRIGCRRPRARPLPRGTTRTHGAPQPALSSISAGCSQGHTSGSKPPPRPSDRPAWSVPRAIAHSGTNEVTSAGSALAIQNNGTSSCVRRPDRAEYSSIDNARVNSGVFADLVTAADQSYLSLPEVRNVGRSASRLTTVSGSRPGAVV